MKNMQVDLENKLFLLGKQSKLVDFIYHSVKTFKTSKIILPCSLHDLALTQKNDFYKFVDFCTSDSMWLTSFFRLKYLKSFDRIYGPDLMLSLLDLFNEVKSDWTHVFVCADQSTAQKMRAQIDGKYPQLRVQCLVLPRNSTEEEKFLRAVLQAKPKVVWLGIGSPKQVELATWLKKNSTGITIFCVGAAFSFVTGQVRQAPIWLQRSGLEWLWRLLVEPRRLWRRYLIIIPKYLLKLLWRSITNFYQKIKL